MNVILDTRAWPSLAHKGATPETYWRDVKDIEQSRLLSAAGILLKVVGSIKLLIQSGLQVARTVVLVVENLAVDMLFGTSFINRNIKGTFPKCGSLYP